MLASESDPDGELEARFGRADVVCKWAIPSPKDLVLFHKEFACLWKWYEAVELYTRGDLTFQTDKLVAVAGIADYIRAMSRNDSVRYLAGYGVIS